MLFWKEFKKTAASLLYVVYILAVIAAYVTQFAPELEVICLNGAGEERSFTLPELLPHSFGPEFLE